MISDFTQLSLTEIRAEAAAIAADAEQMFSHLSTAQLNWQPHAEAWSVAQCLDHLLNANQEMLQAMDKALADTHRPGVFERLPVLPALFGKLMIKAVSPQAKQKLKAPATARPTTSAIDEQIIARFVTRQHALTDRFNALAQAGNVVMTSPFASLVTYSVLDACRLIVAHERRHLAQARRVLETPGFPVGI
ncbi:MAG: DinB family protein [Blastocatellia bacterium]